jgi:hypothetical protein
MNRHYERSEVISVLKLGLPRLNKLSLAVTEYPSPSGSKRKQTVYTWLKNKMNRIIENQIVNGIHMSKSVYPTLPPPILPPRGEVI